jgi:Uma2 family endonuclease
VLNLVAALRAACPPSLEVFASPFDVILGPATLVQPDVLVVRTDEIERLESRALPVLAVEVLSPSTRHYDRGTKRLAYHEAGIASYWIVDPEAPSITVLEWADGELVDEHTVVGADAFTVERPFPFTVHPVELRAPARDA